MGMRVGSDPRIVLAVLLLPLQAMALERVALLVGANPGWDWAQDRPLRYAEEDARRLGSVLTELGDFPDEGIVLLRNPTTEQLLAELDTLQQRLQRSSGEAALFVFYYSGHADDQFLHLRGQPLTFTELYRRLRQVPAAVRLGILDACKSGSMTEVKGARVAPPFRITVREDKAVRGTVILTSSGADEWSQEARVLSGSFFTHHLVSGLRGAADDDHDLRVSLEEVFRYASVRTQLDTSLTPNGPQRPSFRYELKGQGRLFLTRLKGPSAVLLFPAGWPRCFVTDPAERWLIAEFFPQGPGRSRLVIPVGEHVLKCVDGQTYREARFEAKSGAALSVTELVFRQELLQEPLTAVVLKGKRGREPMELLARTLAAQAEKLRVGSPEQLDLSVLLAAESLQRAFTPEGYRAMRRGLERLPRSGRCATREDSWRGPAWHPDERGLAMAGVVPITDSAEGASCVQGQEGGALARMPGGSRYTGMAFTQDGEELVTSTGAEDARVWESATGRELARAGEERGADLMALSQDGKWLATARGVEARVSEVASGRERFQVQHSSPIRALAFSPDGLGLASGSLEGEVRVVETATGRELARFAHGGPVRAVAFSPDSARLAAGADDQRVLLWEVATGRELARLEHLPPPCAEAIGGGLSLCAMARLQGTVSQVESVVFSPDGKYLATGTLDGVVRLWEVDTGKALLNLPQRELIRSLVFSPDGKTLTCATGEPAARSWNVETGEEVPAVTEPEGIFFLQYSADGRYLLTLSGEGKARIWDAGTRSELALVLEDPQLEAVLLSPNGRYLAAARVAPDVGDLSFSVYAWWTEDLVSQACGRLHRDLAPDEWRQYVGHYESYWKTCRRASR
jgi:hypothetical protein